MADQETVNSFYRPAGNGAAFVSTGSVGKTVGSDRQRAADIADSSPAGVVTNVAGFGENLLNLAELQARLTAVELRSNFDSAKSAGAMIIVGTVFAVAGLPVLLVGIAELLVTEIGIKRGYAAIDREHGGDRHGGRPYRDREPLAAPATVGPSNGRRRV